MTAAVAAASVPDSPHWSAQKARCAASRGPSPVALPLPGSVRSPAQRAERLDGLGVPNRGMRRRRSPDGAKPTSTASRTAQVCLPPAEEVFKRRAVFRRRVFAVAHKSLLKLDAHRAFGLFADARVVESTTEGGIRPYHCRHRRNPSSDPAALEPPTAEADAHSSWGRRQAVNHSAGISAMDRLPCLRRRPPSRAPRWSSPLPQHVDPHSGDPWVPRGSADRASKSSSSRPAAG
jgi:hypothetical protein